MLDSRQGNLLLSLLLDKRKKKEKEVQKYPPWRREKDIDGTRWGFFEMQCFDGSKICIEESYSSTGTRVWDTAIVMAKLLEQNPSNVYGKNVLELGAGTGLVGLVAARLGAKSVLLTEISSTLPSLNQAVARNNLGSLCSVKCLDWNALNYQSPGQQQEDNIFFQRNTDQFSFDLILASDVLICRQWACAFIKVLTVISNMIHLSTTTNSSSKLPTILIGSPRDRDGVQHFLELLSSCNFHVTELQPAEFHPDFFCPDIVVFALTPNLLS